MSDKGFETRKLLKEHDTGVLSTISTDVEDNVGAGTESVGLTVIVAVLDVSFSAGVATDVVPVSVITR